MKKRKISKWRIKRGVNFHDEMRKGKYGWNEAAHLGWFKLMRIWQRLFTFEQMGVLGIILSELIKL